jgi:8-oxo-dGTP diphosphatase
MRTIAPEAAVTLLPVAAAVIVGPDGRILISRRHDHLHQGGLWEFPGGKLEPGEDARQALQRELHEELGIEVRQARPLIRVRHDYGERSVLLDVWRVEAFAGTPHGREGQPLAWVAADELPGYDFPAANQPILRAARLPDCYLITPEPGPDPAAFLQQLEAALARGSRLLQLRAKTLAPAAYAELAAQVVPLARARGARVLLNGPAELVTELGAAGLQLSSAALRECRARPLPDHYWLCASCHDGAELARAVALGADCALLSPVQATASHPGAAPLGWAAFQALTDPCPLPVYALGGLGPGDLATAWRHGAQGIAAIRGLWEA